MKNTYLFACVLSSLILTGCGSDDGAGSPAGGGTAKTLSYLLYTDSSDVLRYVNPGDSTDRGAVNLSSDNVTQFTTTTSPVEYVHVMNVAGAQFNDRHLYGNLYHEIVAGSAGKLWYVNRSLGGGAPVATQITNASDIDISCGIQVLPNYALMSKTLITFYQDAGCTAPKKATLDSSETTAPVASYDAITNSAYYSETGALLGALVNHLGLLKKAEAEISQLANIKYADNSDVDLSAVGASVQVAAQNGSKMILAIKVDTAADTQLFRLDPTTGVLSAPLKAPDTTTYVNPLSTTSDGQYLYTRDTTKVHQVAIDSTVDTLTLMVTDTAGIDKISVSNTHLVYETPALVKTMAKNLVEQDAQISTAVKKLIDNNNADVAPGLVQVMGPNGVFIYGATYNYAFYSPYDGSTGTLHFVDIGIISNGTWVGTSGVSSGYLGQSNEIHADNLVLKLRSDYDGKWNFGLIDMANGQKNTSTVVAPGTTDPVEFGPGFHGHFLAVHTDAISFDENLWLTDLNTGTKTVLDTITTGSFTVAH